MVNYFLNFKKWFSWPPSLTSRDGESTTKESISRLWKTLELESTPALKSTLVVNSEIAVVSTDSQISVWKLSAVYQQRVNEIKWVFIYSAVRERCRSSSTGSLCFHIRRVWVRYDSRLAGAIAETTFPHTFILWEGYLLEINNSHSEFSL